MFAFAAHGLFVGDASEVIRQSDLAMTFVTDTVPPFRLAPGMVDAHVRVAVCGSSLCRSHPPLERRRRHDHGTARRTGVTTRDCASSK